MQNTIENLSRVSTRLLFKSYASRYYSEKLFLEGSLRGLIVEEFSDSDANDLQKAIDEVSKIVDGFVGKVSEYESFAPVVDALKGYAGELPDAAGIVDLIMDSDPDALASGVEEFTGKARTLSGDIAALINVVEAMKKNLGNLEPSDPNKTIGELAELGKEGGGFPDAGKLESGIAKAYEVPGWFEKSWSAGAKAAEKEGGGMFKKAMSFLGAIFKGSSSRVVEPKAIADAIMGLTPEQLNGIDLQGESKTMQKVVQSIGKGTGEISSVATGQKAAEDADPTKPDPSAAQAGLEQLKKGDSGKVKDIFAAIQGSLDPEDVAIFKSILDGGKIDDLPDYQQQYINAILQVFAGGVDIAPEQVADAAEDGLEAAEETAAQVYKDLDAIMTLGDTHLGKQGGAIVQGALLSDEGQGLFAHKQFIFPMGSSRLYESRLRRLLFEQEEGVSLEDLAATIVASAELMGVGAPKEDALSAWATAINDELGGINGKKLAAGEGEGAGGFTEESIKASIDAAAGHAKEGYGDTFADKEALFSADVLQATAEQATNQGLDAYGTEGIEVEAFKGLLDAATSGFRGLGAEGEDPTETDILQYLMYMGKGVNDAFGKEMIIGADALESEVEGGAEGTDEEIAGALEDAASDAMDAEVPPAVAVGDALQAWYDGLAASNQKGIGQDRHQELKDSIQTVIDGTADAVAKEVAGAIESWYSSHEETFKKGKKFSKKAKDALVTKVPEIVAAIMKQKAESTGHLTRGSIHRAVHKYLDKKYLSSDVLYESNRWQKLAGLLEG